MSVPGPASEASRDRQLAFRRHEGVRQRPQELRWQVSEQRPRCPPYRGHHPQFALRRLHSRSPLVALGGSGLL